MKDLILIDLNKSEINETSGGIKLIGSFATTVFDAIDLLMHLLRASMRALKIIVNV